MVGVEWEQQFERVVAGGGGCGIAGQKIRECLDQFGGCGFVLHVIFPSLLGMIRSEKPGPLFGIIPAVPAAATDRFQSLTNGVRSSRARWNARVRCENAASCRSTSRPSAACPSLP